MLRASKVNKPVSIFSNMVSLKFFCRRISFRDCRSACKVCNKRSLRLFNSATIVLNESANTPTSSLELTLTLADKFPRLNRRVPSVRERTGRTILLERKYAVAIINMMVKEMTIHDCNR